MDKYHQPSPKAIIAAERAKELRAKMGWSRETAAEKADISVDTYANMEGIRHDPSLTTLDGIATAYGVTIGYLLGEVTACGISSDIVAAYRALGEKLGL